MPLSQKALKFCANNTNNPYELAIVADQLTSFEGVEPKVELPTDWVLEAFTSGKAPQAAFAARTCTNQELLGQVARRDKRITVWTALGKNLNLSEADFAILLANCAEWQRRYLREDRAKATRQAAAARRSETPLAVTPDGAEARAQRVLANRNTYTKASATSVAGALVIYAKGRPEVVGEVLQREGELGGTKLGLAYLRNYYCDDGKEPEREFFDLCTLTPYEVVTLARAKRATFLGLFASDIGSWRHSRRAIEADVAGELIASMTAKSVEQFFRPWCKPGTQTKFSPAAIDVLIEAGFERMLWGHTLSDEQFSRLAGRGAARGWREDLLCHLAGSTPHHIATLLVMANTQARPGARCNYGGNEKMLRAQLLNRVPYEQIYDLLERVAGLAYLLLDDARYSGYIYARLAGTGGVLEAVEELEARQDESLSALLGARVDEVAHA